MDESQDKRVTGADSGISRPVISNYFFHNPSAGNFVSSEDTRHISQLTTKCSAPMGQAKPSRVRCATLTTASL